MSEDFEDDDWLEGDDESAPQGGDESESLSVPKGEVVNKTRLVKLFGLSHATADRHLKEGMPFLSRGTKREGWSFDTAKVAKWLIRRAVSLATGNDDATALESARLRQTDVRARLSELEYARAARETITRAEAIAIYSQQISEFRKRLFEIPDQVSELSEAQRAELDDAINLALEEFSGLPQPGEDDARVAT